MNESIEQIYQGNQGLFGEVEKSNAKFQEILELIKNIESKTKVINDIVFQTKLLSFNASVEAARAGEAGKGFAVVAEEVGNLASMSGKAAFEISGLINTSTQTVEKIVGDAKKFLQEIIVKSKSELDQGRSSTKKCQTSFEKIQDSTNEIGKNLEEMIFAINEQSTGVVEINKATQELDKNTQVLAQESHSLGQSIIQLNESAQSLESSIQTLHQLAGQSAQNDNQDNNFALSVDSNSESDTISSESKILSFLKLKSKTFRKKDSDHVA
ncbi:MAG: methyl-accepting chemotaxis protein [Bacteriovoracaceae bacterium]|nr:methyl-accepting chemotaxis protein [Bacteriovoracaceae bacterium]